ncbi:MAG: hypothetical protein ACJ8C4_04530 [Gemmataceae bacterium]
MSVILAMLALGTNLPCYYGELFQPAYCLDHCLRGPSRPYEPQPGDILFFTDDATHKWDLGYKLAFSGHPYHSGVVVLLPDGELATLESGPDDSSKVEVCSLYERLKFHHCNRGRVWVRRRRVPLTPEENCRLTEFALTQRGKDYALWRLMGQVTPLRSRGPIRTRFMGGCQGPHDSYFCSEVVLEALAYAGAIDPCTTRPRATYPRDFFFDDSMNPYLRRHLNLSCEWEPPARWSTEGCSCGHAYQGHYRSPNPEAIPVPAYFCH